MTSRKLSVLTVVALLVLTAVVGTTPLSVAAAGNDAGNVAVTGSLQSSGNVALSDGVVVGVNDDWTVGDSSSLGASGNFELSTQQGETYHLGYYQSEQSEDGDVTFARDGVPDVYALGSVAVDGETELGTTTLPEATLLTVSVVDRAGNPVSGADVTVVSRANGGSETTGWRMETDSDGNLVNYDNDHAGIEVAGNVELTVDPPAAVVGHNGVYEYADETYTKERVVTEDRHVEFVVEATTIDENTDDGGVGGDGGGGGSAAQDTPAEVTVTDGVAHVSFEPEEGGELVRAPLDGGIAAGDATVDRVAVASVFGYGFDLTVAESESRPADSETLDGHAPVGFFDVETDGVNDGEIDSATIEFTVDERAIPGDSAPADVVLYRYHDGEWQTLDTEHKRGTTYLATSPGFSTFAIGVSDAGDDVSGTRDDSSNLTESESGTDSSPTTSATTASASEGADVPSTTRTESPGFGVSTVLLSLAGFVLFVRRR